MDNWSKFLISDSTVLATATALKHSSESAVLLYLVLSENKLTKKLAYWAYTSLQLYPTDSRLIQN